MVCRTGQPPPADERVRHSSEASLTLEISNLPIASSQQNAEKVQGRSSLRSPNPKPGQDTKGKSK